MDTKPRSAHEIRVFLPILNDAVPSFARVIANRSRNAKNILMNVVYSEVDPFASSTLTNSPIVPQRMPDSMMSAYFLMLPSMLLFKSPYSSSWQSNETYGGFSPLSFAGRYLSQKSLNSLNISL